MPEISDISSQGLFQARAGLQTRLGALLSEWIAVQSELDQINAMLARRGFQPQQVAMPTIPDEQQMLSEELQQRFPASELSQPAHPTLEQIDAAVAKLIEDRGVVGAAITFCEWLIQTGIVVDAITVRSLFNEFTPSLKKQYNPNETAAIETLRSQIKAAVAHGRTALTYNAGGLLGLQPVAVQSNEQETA
jgi:hypothetical protein